VLVVSEAREQLELLAELVLLLDEHEAAVDVVALHHASSQRDEALEEGHPQEVDDALDRRASDVEVDRRAGYGQGVDARGPQAA